MDEYSCTIEATTDTALSAEDAETLAELGGAASLWSGGRRFGVTFTVGAGTVGSVAAEAVARVPFPCRIVLLEVLTVDEADRRLATPVFPELVGVGEVAELLQVTRQRASALQRHRDFPTPVAVLRSGPVWRKADLSGFAESWERQPGRPPKTAVNASVSVARGRLNSGGVSGLKAKSGSIALRNAKTGKILTKGGKSAGRTVKPGEKGLQSRPT